MSEVISQNFEQRIEKIANEASALEKSLYVNEEEEHIQEEEMKRIENGYKALSRRLSATEKNRWGYSPAGWMRKKLVSKHLNSLKNGLFSVFPIPCKGENCPYGDSCLALQNNLEPPYGEPCIVEVNKIENLVVSYSTDFHIDTASTTDRVLIQELIQLDILMDRCQNLMARDISPLQEVTMGVTDDGEAYTQPVVSRYYEAWEKMSKRRQSLFNEMLSTRRAKKDLPEPPKDESEILLTVINNQEDFMKVEERPEKFKEV